MSDEFASLLLLGGAAVASYAAVRAATDALLRPDEFSPAKRAFIHSAMTAIIALMAIFHHPALLDVAVGIPFSATTGALTLAMGVVLFVASPLSATSRLHSRPPIPHATWGLLLPTGLLTLLIGFTGQLTLHSGVILAAEGAAIFLASLGAPSRNNALIVSSDQVATDDNERRQVRRPFAIAQALLALAVALLAGWCMLNGTAGLMRQSPVFRPGVAAVLALGPAIVLPMIPPLATLSERGRRDEAINAIIGFALINLCLVLPIVIVAHKLVSSTVSTAATQPTGAVLPFPILTWRLDTLLIVTIGLLILPTAIGRWTLSRIEGAGLIALYIVYLFITLIVTHG